METQQEQIIETTGTEEIQDVSQVNEPETNISLTDPSENLMPTTEASKLDANQKKQDIYDWTKDKRYGKFWKDPNDLYKSHRSLEDWKKTEHDPLKNKFDSVNKILESHKLDFETLPSVLQEYYELHNTLQDETNPLRRFADFSNDPVYGEKVKTFFDELHNQKMQSEFPGWTRNQIEQHLQMRKELDVLKQEREMQEKNRIYEGEFEQSKKYISDGIDKAQKRADEAGLQFTQELKSELLDYCVKNQVAPKDIYKTFLELNEERLWKAYAERSEKSTISKLNKNKDAFVISPKSASKVNVKASARETLKSKLTNLF